MLYSSTSSDYRRDGRDADLREIQRASQSSDPQLRAAAAEAGRKIANETSLVKSMRESLINEYKHGRMDNVKDIQEQAFKRSDLQNR